MGFAKHKSLTEWRPWVLLAPTGSSRPFSASSSLSLSFVFFIIIFCMAFLSKLCLASDHTGYSHTTEVRSHDVYPWVVNRQWVMGPSPTSRSPSSQERATSPRVLRDFLVLGLETTMVEDVVSDPVVPVDHVLPTWVRGSIVVVLTTVKVLPVLWSSMHHPASPRKEQRPGYGILILLSVILAKRRRRYHGNEERRGDNGCDFHVSDYMPQGSRQTAPCARWRTRYKPCRHSSATCSIFSI